MQVHERDWKCQRVLKMTAFVELTCWNKFVMVSDDLHEGVWQPGNDEHSEDDHQHANHLRQTQKSSNRVFRGRSEVACMQIG